MKRGGWHMSNDHSFTKRFGKRRTKRIVEKRKKKIDLRCIDAQKRAGSLVRTCAAHGSTRVAGGSGGMPEAVQEAAGRPRSAMSSAASSATSTTPKLAS